MGKRTLIMGILNVTPDSFSDGGQYANAEAAIAHGLELLDAGADLLDIGGESTRPGVLTSSPEFAGAVGIQQEIDRILPVLEGLRRARPSAVLSVDTYKSEVAEAAVAAGAEIVNDVSGFTWDPSMAPALARLGCGAILMHTRGRPHEWQSQLPASDIVSLVLDELSLRAQHALHHGMARQAIVLDPGFGFGKNFPENYLLLARFPAFHSLGYPLMAALSRKGFLGQPVQRRLAELDGGEPLAAIASRGAQNTLASVPPAARDTATLAAVVATALSGAHIVRVHNVRPTLEALAIADAIQTAK
ncbi:MAG: dihydropteroate synthase [Acidobacteriota bacterium]|nr:dihydropteroate synthase [Acidobacteriota bacterium]